MHEILPFSDIFYLLFPFLLFHFLPFSFLFLLLLAVKTTERILTHSGSNDAVSHKEVLFRGFDINSLTDNVLKSKLSVEKKTSCMGGVTLTKIISIWRTNNRVFEFLTKCNNSAAGKRHL